MDQINHITLNTGHMRQTAPDEVNKTLYFKLASLIRAARTEKGAEVFPGTSLIMTVDNDQYVATLYARDPEGLCPMLTTAGSPRADQYLWGILHDDPVTPLKTRRDQPVPGPFIADRLDVPHPMMLELAHMTGDLTRCIGWMMLDPDRVKPVVK